MSGEERLAAVDMSVVMKRLGLIRERQRRPQSLGHARFQHNRRPFLRDQRGAVAFETLLVYAFMVSFLVMPLADVAIAGFQFLSAWSALRGFGEYVQYPTTISGFDPTNSSTWPSGTSIGGYQISNPQVFCGDTSNGAACTSTNVVTLPAKYFTYSTTVTLAPMSLLKSVFCTSGNANPCSYTLTYSERFQ